MLLRILLSFFGGFALVVAGALAWMVQQGDGKLPPLQWIGVAGTALGLIVAALAWLKLRPSAEIRTAAAAQQQASGKSGGLKMPTLGKAKDEPVIENFQRRRDPAGLAASVSSAEAENQAASLPSLDSVTSGAEDRPDMPVPVIAPVTVLRRERQAAGDWSGARSWFGGQPRLGDAAWPVGQSTGKHLPFGAQIDLAELAQIRPDSPLPHQGWLAFFLDEGAVVHVPPTVDGARPAITPIPPGVAAYEPGGAVFPENPSPYVSSSFPYWPVELVAAEVAHWEADETATDWASFPPGQVLWWRSVHLLVEQLRRSLHRAPHLREQRQEWMEQARTELAARREDDTAPDVLAKAEKTAARHQTKLEALDREISGIPAVIGLLNDFADGAADWQVLTQADQADFENTFAAIRQQFPNLIKHYTAGDTARLAAMTMHEMFTGDAEAFSALPAAQRDIINRTMRKPFEHNHQMFGEATNIHGGATELQPDYLLLLQMVDDDMIHLRINSGVVSIWIHPADLAAGAWDKTGQLIEC